jgi:hypothetical protein
LLRNAALRDSWLIRSLAKIEPVQSCNLRKITV